MSRIGSVLRVAVVVAGAAWMAPAQEGRGGEGLKELVGQWVYAEDRTPEIAEEYRGPNQRGAFQIRVDEMAVYLEWGTKPKVNVVQINLDGSVTERNERGVPDRFWGNYKDGVLTTFYDITQGSGPGSSPPDTPKKPYNQKQTYTLTKEGLLVEVEFLLRATKHVCLYQIKDRVLLPEPATAKIDALAWLGTTWKGSMGTASIEERFGPAEGGAMLGTARTISGGRMVSFEYLRVIERGGGLVYIAQPGGAAPTEFVLTDISETRAVFENPRHDFPQRIVYQRLGEDGLRTEISFTGGHRPQLFEYTRESR